MDYGCIRDGEREETDRRIKEDVDKYMRGVDRELDAVADNAMYLFKFVATISYVVAAIVFLFVWLFGKI